MKKKSLIFILLIQLLLSGCWDRQELNDISIVTGIAIEKGKNSRYKLSVSSINSAEFSQNPIGDTASILFTLEGDTISELSEKMNVGLSRKQIYSHTRILVIDKEVAKEGLLQFLDYLERSGEFRNDFNILIADNVKASDILKITYPIQKDPALKIHTQIKSFLEEWGGDPKVRLTDFISALLSKGRDPVCALIRVKGEVNKGENIENNKKLEPDAIVEVAGMAVFKQERYIGDLTVEDTRNYMWTQDLKRTTLSVPCKKTGEKIKKYSNIRIIETKINISTKYNNKKPELKVDINSEGRIMGQQCSDNLEDINTYKKYERQTEQYIKNEVKRTIQKVQKEYGVDIFGFGEALYRRNPKQFKKVENKWNDEFKDANVVVNVNVFLRRSGVRSKGYLTELEKINEEKEEQQK